MNVFEDLVVELKEEKLLEETIIDHSGLNTNGNGKQSLGVTPDEFEANFDIDAPSFEPQQAANTSSNRFQAKPKPDVVQRRLSEKMSALHFVEYVLTAVEANFTGAANTPFDDLSIKKEFHLLEQACSDPESDEYFEAQSALMTRLESWEETLAERDRLIPVDALRRYTETANPPLSPQTLFAIIRFYMQIAPSEMTRAKFDFVTTRLFSKFVDGERRDLPQPRTRTGSPARRHQCRRRQDLQRARHGDPLPRGHPHGGGLRDPEVGRRRQGEELQRDRPRVRPQLRAEPAGSGRSGLRGGSELRRLQLKARTRARER